MKIQPSTNIFFLKGKLETSTSKADDIAGENLLAHRKMKAEEVHF